jgi:hypothetical protein
MACPNSRPLPHLAGFWYFFLEDTRELENRRSLINPSVILNMIRIDEFRTGEISLPATDADDVPPACFACVYLSYKEFSMGDGLYYYHCGYHSQDRTGQPGPPCLPDPGAPRN